MSQARIRDIIFSRYQSETNMNFSELMRWKVGPYSKLASLDRRPINLAIRLKNKHKKDWTTKDYRGALKAISYLKRAKKIKGGPKIARGYTKNQIALKNWGYDIKKARGKSRQ